MPIETRLIMGLPVTVALADAAGTPEHLERVFAYFEAVDARYSTYKEDSEISRINAGLPEDQWSQEMKYVLDLCDETRRLTAGYFDINRGGRLDPSGLVKGWAIQNAAEMLLESGLKNFFIDAGGDIAAFGHNRVGRKWRVGVRNPFSHDEIIKILAVSDRGVATSGTAIRGQHIYNPLTPSASLDAVKSITVIGPNVYEADRFATAALGMGRSGIGFIEQLEGFEAYIVDAHGHATLTGGFERYVAAA
ncbi:MAG: FAD:protein FMN transferase [Candidatus Saccharimonadales bacterium]